MLDDCCHQNEALLSALTPLGIWADQSWICFLSFNDFSLLPCQSLNHAQIQKHYGEYSRMYVTGHLTAYASVLPLLRLYLCIIADVTCENHLFSGFLGRLNTSLIICVSFNMNPVLTGVRERSIKPPQKGLNEHFCQQDQRIFSS